MSSLSQYDLRVINKFIQYVKQSFGIQLEYRDPSLGQKICDIVSEKDDPELTMLWNTLSVQYRAKSIPAKQNDEKSSKVKKRLYRGKTSRSKESKEPAKVSKPDTKEREPENSEATGHYIIYRGKKRWVAK